MKKKILIIVLCVLLVSLALPAVIFMHGKTALKGYALFADNGSFLFIDESGEPICMRDLSDGQKQFDSLQTGDEILIIAENAIEESYPAQCGAYKTFRLKKGDESNIPEETLSPLRSLGWVKNTQHEHTAAQTPQTVADPVSGYCGNIETTIILGSDKKYTFMYEDSVALTDIVINLQYDKSTVCDCEASFRVIVEGEESTYEVNTEKYFVRCEKGLAQLTKEQAQRLDEVVKNQCK